MIFVTVGSRNYPFDRLFKKLDELYEKGVLTDSMFAQIGTSTYKPKHYEYKDFISQEEFLEKVKEADIVVSWCFWLYHESLECRKENYCCDSPR